jgi:hypothetical protein
MATRGNTGQRRRLKIIVLADLTRSLGPHFFRPGLQFVSVDIKSHGATQTNIIAAQTWGKAKADAKTPPARRRAVQREVRKRKTEPPGAAPLRDNL